MSPGPFDRSAGAVVVNSYFRGPKLGPWWSGWVCHLGGRSSGSEPGHPDLLLPLRSGLQSRPEVGSLPVDHRVTGTLGYSDNPGVGVRGSSLVLGPRSELVFSPSPTVPSVVATQDLSSDFGMPEASPSPRVLPPRGRAVGPLLLLPSCRQEVGCGTGGAEDLGDRESLLSFTTPTVYSVSGGLGTCVRVR